MTLMKKTGYRSVFFEELDSTNEEAKRQAQAGAESGLLIVADKQIKGRGRRGRSWESPAGSNIFMSLLLRPTLKMESASMITLVMALSVSEAITEMTGLFARIKWPNDVVVNGRKTVGILTELFVNGDGSWYLICGVGINVNQKSFPGELAETATSLFLESDTETDRRKLTEKVMERFDENYRTFCNKETMEDLMEVYNTLLVNKDAAVRVLDPKGEYEGMALGINREGELLVRKEDGSIEDVYAGEVSVRGIYGYV